MSATRTDLREWRRRYAAEHPEDPRHGTLAFARYYCCKCLPCALVKRAEDTAYRRRRGRLHEPTVYTVTEHRAFKEPLCPACIEFVQRFTG